jgi:hypothetical protein
MVVINDELSNMNTNVSDEEISMMNLSGGREMIQMIW